MYSQTSQPKLIRYAMYHFAKGNKKKTLAGEKQSFEGDSIGYSPSLFSREHWPPEGKNKAFYYLKINTAGSIYIFFAFSLKTFFFFFLWPVSLPLFRGHKSAVVFFLNIIKKFRLSYRAASDEFSMDEPDRFFFEVCSSTAKGRYTHTHTTQKKKFTGHRSGL